jgi:hypothetical protein
MSETPSENLRVTVHGPRACPAMELMNDGIEVAEKRRHVMSLSGEDRRLLSQQCCYAQITKGSIQTFATAYVWVNVFCRRTYTQLLAG